LRIAINAHMVFPPYIPMSGIGFYSFNLISALSRQMVHDDFIIFSTPEGRLRWSQSLPFDFCSVRLPTWKNLVRIFWEQLILPVELLKKKPISFTLLLIYFLYVILFHLKL